MPVTSMHSDTEILTRTYLSPAGTLILGSCSGKLCLCDWAGRPFPGIVADRLRRILCAKFREGRSAITDSAVMQLEAYFAGELTSFSLPLLTAGTRFQENVWRALASIPYGHTLSYRQLAESVGNPAAVRAVANANRLNAISIIIPCHRVIGSNGAPTGYAGGIAAKKLLLELETSVSGKIEAGGIHH